MAVLLTSNGHTYGGEGKDVYPGIRWAKMEAPEKFGWSLEGLAEARRFSKVISSTAVMIVQHGLVVDAWGEIATKSSVHSVRKSLLSALIGIAADKGQIDISKTMADLGIDDTEPSLTELEKRATVRDLLTARSGIYHPANYETQWMINRRPARGSYAPGTFFYYNNWDFNTLGTIYQQQSGKKIFEAFKSQIADPLQMEDFEVSDGRYLTGKASRHAHYPFRMTARDLARFGLLYLRKGRWKDRQIISSDWIDESTKSHSETTQEADYGYMWWTGKGDRSFVPVKEHSYFARGYRGQYVFVIPHLDLVVVHRFNTDWKGRGPSHGSVLLLLGDILSAAGENTK